MAKRRKLNTPKSADNVSEKATQEEESISVESSAVSGSYIVTVPHHTHQGVAYKSGDPIVIDNPATVAKLRARGIIS